MLNTVVLRADAAAHVGIGHVVRSLTLGRALAKQGWRVLLVTANLPELIATRAREASIEIVPLYGQLYGSDDAAVVLSSGPDLVVADGYHFEAAFYEALVKAGAALCVIDDNYENVHSSVRVIINQNPSPDVKIYNDASLDTSLFLGLRYALIRDEVTSARSDATDLPRTGVFVSMGGSDPLELGERLASALSGLGISTRIILGPAMNDREAVVTRVGRLAHVEIVSDHGFVDAMSTSEITVIGAGTTIWEAACLGVASISLIVAENQVEPAWQADALGFTLALDARLMSSLDPIVKAVLELLADDGRRERMSEAGRSMVDGRGAARVASYLSGLTGDEVRTPC